ncbi:MAG: hypothetical protein HY923_10410 [Elusimicrobia bacterium]|nr:hypothetical protein [Elusimicrobiota bacterium]
MNTLLMTGLLVGLCALPVRAEESASAEYGGGVRYVDLDIKGSKGQVQEYNGKQYFVGEGDLWLNNQGAKGLIDLDFNDIGSGEENGSVHVDLGDWFKASAKLDRMTHRQNMTDFGIIVNGQFVKIPTALSKQLFGADTNMLYKRTESEINLAVFDSQNSARWLSLQYWSVYKKGSAPNGLYTGGILYFAEASVDNTTNEIALGVGHDVTADGAMSLDLIRREFKDESVIVKFNPATANQAFRPSLPRTEMTAAEMRFRYNASKDLAFTGALTGRQRENLFNQYRFNAAVAAFNAAYKATDKLSLTARLYGRVFEVDENKTFINVVSNNPPANTHQLDKMTAKGDFALSYRPVKPVLLKAGYKVEVTHRRDAPAEIFGAAVYSDGTYVYAGQNANSVATDDVKHTFNAGMKADLPLDIEVDADYKKMKTNRAAFVNMPTQGDEASLTVNVPLPGHLELYAMALYLKEHNAIELTNYHLTRNAYRTGLDWEAENRVFVGADASYETTRRTSNGWFGATNALVNPALTGFEHVGGMYNRQNNTTTGLHARVNLPKGFVVKANGSYTWSTVATPLDMQPRTDPGQFLGDITPGDVRIARGGAALEFTPAKYKHLTARASYRVDDWVDKYDSNNSGRASVTQVGVSAKF